MKTICSRWAGRTAHPLISQQRTDRIGRQAGIDHAVDPDQAVTGSRLLPPLLRQLAPFQDLDRLHICEPSFMNGWAVADESHRWLRPELCEDAGVLVITSSVPVRR